MTRKFQRRVEDFICEHCGRVVRGNGYTNHCPNCLYSKHVDVNPGDRAEACGGLMKPVAVEAKDKNWVVVHQCVRCGFLRKNKIVPDDNREALYKL